MASVVTLLYPQVDGYVIGSCIKHIPLAGRDVTNFILQFLRDRGENIPSEDQLGVARVIKERYCYVCKDLVAEYKAYDEDDKSNKLFRKHKHLHKKTGKVGIVFCIETIMKNSNPYIGIHCGRWLRKILGARNFLHSRIFFRAIFDSSCRSCRFHDSELPY